MDLGISGRRAIVCASTGGLGYGCAVALAEAGCHVVINGRDPQTVEEVAYDLEDRWCVRVTGVTADIATTEGQQALLRACPDPDILVTNNLGSRTGRGERLGQGPRPGARFEVRGALGGRGGRYEGVATPRELIYATIDGMAERGFGRIVNIVSGAVNRSFPDFELALGGGAGLMAFLAGIATRFASRNVTLNNLLPGVFGTDSYQQHLRNRIAATGAAEETIALESVEGIPARRAGTTEEFGQTCAFLCSQYAGYLTGRNLVLDGGYYLGAHAEGQRPSPYSIFPAHVD